MTARWPLVLPLLGLALTAATAPVATLVDPARCQVRPGGTVTVEAGTAVASVRLGEGPEADVLLQFREPLASAGSDRLVIEARAEEPTGTYLCLSRTVLLSADATSAVYEPDLLVPPSWCRREVLVSDLPPALPATVTAVRLHIWAPYSAGREVRLFLRRLEWQSREEVAASLRPGPATRTPLPPAPVAPGPADQRWVNLGPGGGGWFRTVAISPLDGTCFIGGDVGGVYRSGDRGRTWELCNAGITNLYINTFAFHPADARVLYAGSNGGPLKSTDGGRSWSLQRNGLPPLLTFGRSAPVAAIVVDRADPRRVLAGIGQEREYGALSRETVGGRVLLSDDAGETWRPVDLPLGPGGAGASVLGLTQHPRDANVILAVTPIGLCRSADRGSTWTRWGDGLDAYRLSFLAIRRDQPDTMLLSCRRHPDGPGGVLRSRDGGRTWEPAGQGLPAKDRSAWRLVADPRDVSRFYLGYNSQAGLYVTRDGGDSWTTCSSPRQTRWTWAYAHAICTGLDVDPSDPQRLVFCDDIDICQTLDGGATWQSVIADPVAPATPERPATWRGRGCEILCMGGPQALAVDPARPQTLFAGYWDLHAWRSDDGGQSFARIVNGTNADFGRMGAALIDPVNPDVMWVSVGANYDRQRLYRSNDGGHGFRLVGHAGNGLPPGGVFTLVLDPASPPQARTLYAGVAEHGVYRSTDGGLTWEERSQGLPADSRLIRQIAVDPRDPGRLFVAAGAHYHPDTRRRAPGYLAVSSDGGANWRLVKERVEAQCIVIDPFDSRRVYAGNRNYSGIDYPNALYRSEDGGQTWKALTQDAFAAGPTPREGDQGWRVFVACLAADPSTPGRLYAGLTCESYDTSNGRGVFVSRDHGATWEPFPCTGLTNLAVATLVVDPVNPQRLYAGTGGNGLFRWGPAP